MENLRWILIFAGVAILVLLYFSGRQKKTTDRQRSSLNSADRNDADNIGFDSSANSGQGRARVQRAPDPLLNDEFGEALTGFEEINIDADGTMGEENVMDRPGGPDRRARRTPSSRDTNSAAAGGLSSITTKIEAFGKKLSARRGERVAASEPRDDAKKAKADYGSKIVTLHVVAAEGRLFNGGQLLDLFEQRGYHYGDMNIFHSMHHDKAVFSIAKLVVPGTFDINDVDSFQTPGISLILQLPGPAPADVAFEVMLSEAADIAGAMEGFVLDADRSTLSKQTIAHMREGIYEYMHRQKYFSAEPS